MIIKLLNLLGGDELVADFKVFSKYTNQRFWSLFIKFPEFRYLFFYRLRMHKSQLRILLKPLKFHNNLNLYINCNDIGSGLFIEHGFSTIISCKHMGKNCWINQQVTIGFSNETDSPIIGNDVHIKAGAKIIGGVKIGDDVIIGANAVVVKDIPSHSIVVGVPARIIKYRNSMNEPWQRNVSKI